MADDPQDPEVRRRRPGFRLFPAEREGIAAGMPDFLEPMSEEELRDWEGSRIHMESVCVLDFEASSLAGWPIEIGVSQLIAGTARTWSLLIGPAADWPLTEWSEIAERVHGVARGEFDHAPGAAEVVAGFLRCVGDRVILSDAPEYESKWLRLLFAAASRRDTPRVEDYHAVTFRLFEADPAGLDRVYEYLTWHPAPHRAGPDAEGMVRAWLAGRRAEAGEPGAAAP